VKVAFYGGVADLLAESILQKVWRAVSKWRFKREKR
jgi:hypothetical protein